MDWCNFTDQLTPGLNSQSTVVLWRVCNATCFLQGWEWGGMDATWEFQSAGQHGSTAVLLHGRAAPTRSGCLSCPCRDRVGLVDVNRLAAFLQSCDG